MLSSDGCGLVPRVDELIPPMLKLSNTEIFVANAAYVEAIDDAYATSMQETRFEGRHLNLTAGRLRTL